MTKHYLAAFATGHRYRLCLPVEHRSGFCFRAGSLLTVISSVPDGPAESIHVNNGMLRSAMTPRSSRTLARLRELGAAGGAETAAMTREAGGDPCGVGNEVVAQAESIRLAGRPLDRGALRGGRGGSKAPGESEAQGQTEAGGGKRWETK